MGTLLPPPNAAVALTDEEKRKAFIESRGGKSKKNSGDSAASSTSAKKKKPKTKAKPKPARPKHKITPHPTPHHRSQEAETPEHKPTPEPEATPKPEGTPKPGEPGALPQSSGTAQPQTSSSSSATVIVQKSGEGGNEEPAPTPAPSRGWWFFGGPRYKYLTSSVRAAIDRAPVARHRWRYIVVHNSGTRQGNAKAFDYYHLHVRKMPNGLAYHFVIGNGTSSGNGLIEIGGRWVRQINGGHVHSDYLNNIALGICLVGDCNREKPTARQLEALDELIRYLRSRVGKTEHKAAIVKAHKDINPPQWPTDCPGDKFPYRWLYSHFD